jgi:ribosomal protein L37E
MAQPTGSVSNGIQPAVPFTSQPGSLGATSRGPRRGHGPPSLQRASGVLSSSSPLVGRVSGAPGGRHSPITTTPQGQIVGTYRHDYDILGADQIVTAYLALEQSGQGPKTTRLQAEMATLEQQYHQAPTTARARELQRKLEQRRQSLAVWTSGRKIAEYRQAVDSYLNEYRLMGLHVRQLRPGVLEESQPDRIRVIARYLATANAYYDIQVRRADKQLRGCFRCGQEPGHAEQAYCESCGLERLLLVSGSDKKEARPAPEIKGNVVKAWQRYQGLQNDTISAELLEALDQYFIGKGLPDGATVRSMPLGPRRYRGNTNHKLLYTALEETNFRDYYEDAELIGHLYWGWELPDVNHLEQAFFEIYQTIEAAYLSIPYKGRKSDLGTQITIFRILHMLGHDCRKSEFKVPKMDKCWESSEDLWQKACRIAGLNDSRIRYYPLEG